jgi:DNA repair protein RecO (recombination protein O)
VQQDFRALVCSLRAHGEHGVIARVLTREAGLVAGYVRGGRSRALRPVLIPGNSVMTYRRLKSPGQLAGMTLELLVSRAALLEDPLAAAGLDWVCALVAATLPEDQPHPDIFDAFEGLLAAIEAAPSARRWAGAVVSFEQLLLRALGYGGAQPPVVEDWPSVLAGLTANGVQLPQHLLTERQRDILPARERLMDRIKRAVA